MSETIAELQSLSEEELIRRHDEMAAETRVGTQHYLEALAHRYQQRQTDEMLRLTNEMHRMTSTIRNLTWVIGLLTLASMIVMIVRD